MLIISSSSPEYNLKVPLVHDFGKCAYLFSYLELDEKIDATLICLCAEHEAILSTLLALLNIKTGNRGKASPDYYSST